MKNMRRAAAALCLTAALLLALGGCAASGPGSCAPAGPAQSATQAASPSATGNTASATPAPGTAGTSVPRTQYDISLSYDEPTHTANATEAVTYTNGTGTALAELYLHLYPNHFKQKEYVDMVMMGQYQAYPGNTFDAGWIDVPDVRLDGVKAEWDIGGAERTLLHIKLPQALQQGGSIRIDTAFSLKLPRRIGRFAWEDASANFGNWYPILAVYDDEGWNLDPYYEVGDPFYSETSDYRVELDLPEGLIPATTGKIVSQQTSGGRTKVSVQADGERDFTFALSRDYSVYEETVDGVKLRVLTTPGDAANIDEAKKAAASSLKAYDKAFGQYDGETLSVAFVDDVTGMEFPGIVFIDHTLLKGSGNVDFLERCIVHEIAHQWWYSAVGNDEIDEPWLDESLTSFSEYVYVAAYQGWAAATSAVLSKGAKLTQPLLLTLNDQKNWDNYIVIYRYGPEFFLKLREKLGGAVFDTMLRDYYTAFDDKVAHTEDLRAMVEQTGNQDALAWFDKCVYGK
jgi:hypothetical protein